MPLPFYNLFVILRIALLGRGGFFAGKVASATTEVEKGSRFDPSLKNGAMYRERYLQEGYFKV